MPLINKSNVSNTKKKKDIYFIIKIEKHVGKEFCDKYNKNIDIKGYYHYNTGQWIIAVSLYMLFEFLHDIKRSANFYFIKNDDIKSVEEALEFYKNTRILDPRLEYFQDDFDLNLFLEEKFSDELRQFQNQKSNKIQYKYEEIQNTINPNDKLNNIIIVVPNDLRTYIRLDDPQLYSFKHSNKNICGTEYWIITTKEWIELSKRHKYEIGLNIICCKPINPISYKECIFLLENCDTPESFNKYFCGCNQNDLPNAIM